MSRVRHSKALKHLIDRVAAAAALPWAVPPFLLICAALKVEDLLTGEGFASVFYRERRYSANQPFDLVKFRVVRASVLEAWRAEGKTTIKELEHDPQAVSRVGRVLVRYYLDELPQLFHVLRGTMSLVGPRPVWPHDTRRLEEFAPYTIRAGLAGTFQLAKGTGDILDLDRIYLREYAERPALSQVRYDLDVLLQTIRKMRRGEGL